MIKPFEKQTSIGPVVCVSLTDLMIALGMDLSNKSRWMKNNIINKNRRFFRGQNYWKEKVGETKIGKNPIYDYHIDAFSALEAIGDINSAKAEVISRILLKHAVRDQVKEALAELDNNPDIQPETIVVEKSNFGLILIAVIVSALAGLSLLAQATGIISF